MIARQQKSLERRGTLVAVARTPLEVSIGFPALVNRAAGADTAKAREASSLATIGGKNAGIRSSKFKI